MRTTSSRAAEGERTRAETAQEGREGEGCEKPRANVETTEKGKPVVKAARRPKGKAGTSAGMLD